MTRVVRKLSMLASLAAVPFLVVLLGGCGFLAGAGGTVMRWRP